MQANIEVIQSNLFELADQLNLVGSFVDTISHLSKELGHYGHYIDLDTVFGDIRDQLNDVSKEIEQNVKGLQLLSLS